jgi:sulfite exporter TauE/SafE
MQLIGLTTGFLVGIAGSLHCVGICSGIATSLAHRATPPGASPMASALAVNAGRMGGYMLAGAAVGLAGRGLAGMFDLAGLNTALRWLAAGVIMWTGLSLADAWIGRLVPALAGRSGQAVSPVLSGLAWGFMPCGMVYLALFNASLTGSPVWGAAYMAAFALGTMPALLATAWGAGGLLKKARQPTTSRSLRRGLGLAVAALAPLTLLARMPAFAGLCGGG